MNRSRTKIIVVSAVTTSSTNITGFFINVRGLSLMKAEPIAGMTIFGSSSAETGMLLRICEVSIGVNSGSVRRERAARDLGEMFNQRPKSECREECQATDDQDHADDKADEEPAGGRESACRWRNGLLGR